jgi:hypothetical protein|tara:strand:- start:3 stop:380 length:378 start_codon:yes stop_codon:yes gene_type:complete
MSNSPSIGLPNRLVSEISLVNYILNKKKYDIKIAGIALYKVAIIAIFGVNAIAGNKASPSFDIAFPINAAKGIIPLRYKVVTNIWGPQPGINPINIASRGININAESDRTAKSNPKKEFAYSYAK